jgi:stage V sporulation protein B
MAEVTTNYGPQGPRPSSKRQSRVTGAISLLVAQAIVLFFGYATHLWIGRLLGPGPYGVYGVVLSAQIIVGLFLTLGVPSAVSRFVAQDENHAQSILLQALRIQAAIAITLAVATAILAPVIAGWLNDYSLTNLLRFVSVIIFFQAFYPIYVQFLSGMHRFNKQATLTTIYAAAKLAGAIGFLYFFGVYGAFIGFAVGGITAAIIGWWWTLNIGGEARKKLSLPSFLSFAGTIALVLVGLQALMSIDLFMVKAILRDDVQAGFYNAAVTLSRIPYFLLQGLAFILLPSVSALTKPGASHARAAQFINDTLRYLIALIVPGMALAAATSKQLVRLFFSEAFIPAAPALTVLMIGLSSLAFFLLLSYVAAGAGKARAGLYTTFLMLAISAVAGLYLIPNYGLIGAAWQTTIASVTGLTIISVYTFYTFRLPRPLKSTVNVIIATLVAVMPTYVWAVPVVALPLQYLALFGLYVATLFFLGEVSVADRRRLASIHPRLQWLAVQQKQKP